MSNKIPIIIQKKKILRQFILYFLQFTKKLNGTTDKISLNDTYFGQYIHNKELVITIYEKIKASLLLLLNCNYVGTTVLISQLFAASAWQDCIQLIAASFEKWPLKCTINIIAWFFVRLVGTRQILYKIISPTDIEFDLRLSTDDLLKYDDDDDIIYMNEEHKNNMERKEISDYTHSNTTNVNKVKIGWKGVYLTDSLSTEEIMEFQGYGAQIYNSRYMKRYQKAVLWIIAAKIDQNEWKNVYLKKPFNYKGCFDKINAQWIEPFILFCIRISPFITKDGDYWKIVYKDWIQE